MKKQYFVQDGTVYRSWLKNNKSIKRREKAASNRARRRNNGRN